MLDWILNTNNDGSLDWTAGNHEVERKRFIERLQQYARDRSIRVSLIGGDVSFECGWCVCMCAFVGCDGNTGKTLGPLLWRWTIVFQGHA